MKVLMLIAHGSRNQGANEEVVRLAERVGKRARGVFDAVVPAFLELAEPDIHRGIDTCVELGADEVVAVPYFLAGGNHVRRDIPAELACAGAKHPRLRIEISSYVGASEEIGDLVLHAAKTRANMLPGD